jgi:Ti-type conjugative transfer relaxase TraA
MAIYHLHAKVISRANGRSAVAAAAYRSASVLPDERLSRSHDFTNKAGVVHSEILLPPGAPERLLDRSTLWNEVERTEVRKDAQLARELEFSIPREMPKDEGIRLAQDFVREQFVGRGMVADLNVHWAIEPDGEAKPHAHVMLAMRVVGPDGFGLKARDWNRTGLLEDWRERWATLANERLAELGLDLRIDHRTYAEQGIALEPQNKIGPAGARREDRGEQAERAAEHDAIARRNGERIIAEPVCVLDAITRQQSTFTRQDMARFIDRHTADAAQFAEALAKVEASPALVRVGVDGRGRERFSTREMLEVEQRLEAASYELAGRAAHGVGVRVQERVLENAERALGSEQRAAFEHVTGGADIAAVVGYAGTGKSTMLGVARAAWEASGYRVRGAALSGIAAEGLEAGAGIESRTLASLEHGWAKGRDPLTSRDVLVVDEAGMVGSRQMERVLSAARNAGAKVVLAGDAEQLQAIEAGAAFRAVAERVGSVEITTVIRQQEAWQREATRELATGRTTGALARYEAAGMVQASSTREEARAALVAGWDAARQERGKASQMILAYTRDDVRALNELARARMRITGDLHGADQVVATERGERAFAAGDRILFQRNERGLGGDGHSRGGAAVKNGTLGTVLEVAAGGGWLTVRLDGPGGSGRPSAGQGKTGGREVTFDLRDYAHIDHGYAATVHKSQGVTVDRAHVLATPHMDRHAAYVGLTRHRDGVALHYAREDFGEPTRLARALGRERAKDTTLDYDREDESVRRYAARRWLAPESEIVVRAPELVREAPKPATKRGKFSGLKLDAGRSSAVAPEVARPVPSVEPAPVRSLTERERQQERMEGLAAGYARAWVDAERMRRASLPVLPHQEQALQAADHALEEFGLGMGRDVGMALEAAPILARGIETKDGRQALTAAAMEVRQNRQALDRRVWQAVRGWEALERAHDQAAGEYDWDAARAVTQRLVTYAQALKQDPQVESALLNRAEEFGVEKGSRLERVVQAPKVTERLMRQVGLEQARGRDHGPSLGM